MPVKNPGEIPVMKSQKFIYIVLIILLLIAILLFLKDKTGTIRNKEKDLNISSGISIDKIRITMDSLMLTLTNESGTWHVNNTYIARSEPISAIEFMLHHIEIVSPVPREYTVLARKKLREHSRRIDVFSGKKMVKSYYILYDSSRYNATIMMLANAKTPFIVKISGYDLQNIAGIFALDARYWRSNKLPGYSYDQLQSVKVRYTTEPEQSFEILKEDNKRIRLIALKSGEDLTARANRKDIDDYMYFFSGITFRYPSTEINTDTLKNSKFAEIILSGRNTKNLNLTFFRKSVNEALNGDYTYDLNTCYGVIGDETEPVEFRYIDIDPLLKELSDFLKK